MKNGITIRPIDAWKEKHCVISEHQYHLPVDMSTPSQKSRIVYFICVLLCMIVCIAESAEFRNLRNKLSYELRPVHWKKVNILSVVDTATLRVQTEIFSQVVECCSSTYRHLVGESKAKIVAHMDMLLRVVRQRGKKFSGQEIDDINMEIQRFQRVCQLNRLMSEPNYRVCCNNPEVKECYETAHQIAYTVEKYTEEFDWKPKNALEHKSRVVHSAVEITDVERKEIERALGYKQGHCW
jgi:hypothetical protein